MIIYYFMSFRLEIFQDGCFENKIKLDLKRSILRYLTLNPYFSNTFFCRLKANFTQAANKIELYKKFFINQNLKNL